MKKKIKIERININFQGTKLFFKPGMLTGGKVKHDCPNSRAIGYYLEALVLLAPFGKEPLNVVLNGVTNHMDNLDISVFTSTLSSILSLFLFFISSIFFFSLVLFEFLISVFLKKKHSFPFITQHNQYFSLF